MPTTAERIGTMLCGVGESPVWRSTEQAFYWTDIPGRTLWRWTPATDAFAQWALPQMAGSIAMRGDGWLLAMEDGLYSCAALELDKDCAPWPLAAVSHAAPGMRFNDGRCDRQGRFVAGTMVMEMGLASPAGVLYRHDAQGLSVLMDDLIVPNGLGFSPDGKTMYLSDSHPSRATVWAFDYDSDASEPRNRRVFIDALPAGRPDGAAVDTDGCYWICGNDAGKVYRYTPDGRLDRTLDVPAAKVAMCAFGGPGMDTLFVTSIRPANAAPGSPDGAVFALRPGAQGLEEAASAG
ncbi:SMP-30/gluconolactonase/LRE family protein [Achromobacter sp.]|uniref:SMP-30/gluconolactonase/LRE family protein n=1 Tax=Achromobacter sp. TaxID=134375 RepID=UPI0028A82EDA|nr:SMP-30/gluconolactonase/LRE family protein [Achromobacter sp.]